MLRYRAALQHFTRNDIQGRILKLVFKCSLLLDSAVSENYVM